MKMPTNSIKKSECENNSQVLFNAILQNHLRRTLERLMVDEEYWRDYMEERAQEEREERAKALAESQA